MKRMKKNYLDFLAQYGKRDELQAAPTYAIGNIKPPDNVDGLRSGFQLVREHIPTGFLKSVKVTLNYFSEIEITPNHHCGEDVFKPVFEPIWLIIGLKISSPQ